MISTYHITTSMGNCFDNLPFLSDEEHKEFDSIGYSGKTLDGKKTNRYEYLNSLGKGDFDITQTKFDDGSFTEEFTIVWVQDEEEEVDIELSKTEILRKHLGQTPSEFQDLGKKNTLDAMEEYAEKYHKAKLKEFKSNSRY